MMRSHETRLLPSRAVALATPLIAAAMLAACGSSATSSSSTTSTSTTSAGASTSSTASDGKPSYCTSLNTLEASVKAIPNVDEVKKNGTNALKSSITQVQMNANTVVNEAKAQFVSQTSALKAAIDTLSAGVEQVASPPTASQLKALPAQVVAVATATKDLTNSAAPSCG